MATAKERLFFNEARTKLVKENDPEAKILAAAVGDEIPEIPNEEKKGVVVEKAADKPANKAVKADEDK